MIGVGLRGVKETAPECLTDRKTDHYTGAFTEYSAGARPPTLGITRAHPRNKARLKRQHGQSRRPERRFERLKGDTMRKLLSQGILFAVVVAVSVAATGCSQYNGLKAKRTFRDANGLYHKFIQEMIQTTDGNILIILLNKEEESDQETKKPGDLKDSIYERFLYDPELVKKLSQKGQQPSVELLAKNLMAN